MYNFLKKDGTILQRYKTAIDLILKSEIEHTQIVRGRYDEVIDEYDNFEIKIDHLLTPKKRKLIADRIEDICKEFNMIPSRWYSSGLDSLKIKPCNKVRLMKSILNKYI